MIKLAKKGIFIYNSFHRQEDLRMFNLHNRKTKKIISSIIIILIVIAMFIPTLTYFIF